MAADQKGRRMFNELDWTKPTALMMGAEGAGFSSEQLAMLDETIKIPMAGRVESLNVGTAAAVCLFEAVSQRQRKLTP